LCCHKFPQCKHLSARLDPLTLGWELGVYRSHFESLIHFQAQLLLFSLTDFVMSLDLVFGSCFYLRLCFLLSKCFLCETAGPSGRVWFLGTTCHPSTCELPTLLENSIKKVLKLHLMA